MSEPILKALIQLFALISDVHAETVISSRGRDIVRLFLARQLNNELVLKYLAMFDDYLRLYHQEHISRGTLKERKRTSLTAMRILSKCEKINEELHQRQKIYVMVQLMDFISFSETVTEQEMDFLGLVATAFNIETREYENIKTFVLGPGDMEPERNRLMIIDSEKNWDRKEIKHICKENLKGRLLFLHILSTNTLIMRYTGGEDMFLNGQNIFPGRTYVFDHGSSIRGSVTGAVYYNDVAGVFTGEAFKLKVSLDARDISLKFRNSDSGLQKLNFHEESGRLVAIMGGSGVGKSTLMNILSGVTVPDTG
ncbi:MAG: ATP-binding cassette domain-containing protein, partial [Bacteroidales bacterium]|nr:ATP-binding cassette domain-containing protein [Bacteroidales bacterium]